MPRIPRPATFSVKEKLKICLFCTFLPCGTDWAKSQNFFLRLPSWILWCDLSQRMIRLWEYIASMFFKKSWESVKQLLRKSSNKQMATNFDFWNLFLLKFQLDYDSLILQLCFKFHEDPSKCSLVRPFTESSESKYSWLTLSN